MSSSWFIGFHINSDYSKDRAVYGFPELRNQVVHINFTNYRIIFVNNSIIP
jgi:hypothetical protein